MPKPSAYAKGKSYTPVENPTWRDLCSNPFLHHPTPEMLQEGGAKIEGFFKVRGMSRYDPAIYCEVLFDKEFVKEWLQRKLGALLNSLTYNEWQKLLKEVKDAPTTKG
jgi:hypothetical protein